MVVDYQELLDLAQASGSNISVKVMELVITPQAPQNNIWGQRAASSRLPVKKDVRSMPLLTTFIENAMAEAKYESFADGSIYASIPSCPGVWSNEVTLEECARDLREVLEFWLLLKLRDNDPLPVIGEIDLNSIEEVEG